MMPTSDQPVSLLLDLLEAEFIDDRVVLKSIGKLRLQAQALAGEGKQRELTSLAFKIAEFLRSRRPRVIEYRCSRCGATLKTRSTVCTCVLSSPSDIPRIVFFEGRRPRVLRTTRRELDELKYVQIRRRPDWPAVFSCNPIGEIWLFVTYDYTPRELRVSHDTLLLENIVETYLEVRGEGGRFFVNEQGAFYRAQGEPLVHFVEFKFDS